MSRRPDRLNEEDRVLWNLVARTAKPLKGKAVIEVPEVAATVTPEQAPAARSAAPASPAKPKTQHVARCRSKVGSTCTA